MCNLKNSLFGTILILSISIVKGQVPSLTTPNNGATVPVQFKANWTDVNNAEDYIYQIDTVETFDSPYLIERSDSRNWQGQTFEKLLYGHTFFWRVASVINNDTSEFSNYRTFTTENIVGINSPVDNYNSSNVSLDFRWNSISGSRYYVFQFDTIPSFDSPVLRTERSSTSFPEQSFGDFRFGATYYWRIAAFHDLDTSDYSVARVFTTPETIAPTRPLDGEEYVGSSFNFRWDGIAATKYEIQLDVDSSFNSDQMREETTANSNPYKTIYSLDEQPYWYWRVRGVVDNDTSEWSTHRIFYTDQLVTSTEDKTVQLVVSNPFSNHLVLKVPNIQYAELFDMNGRLVYEGEGMYISTAHLEEGYYILQMQTEGKVLSQMLLKK